MSQTKGLTANYKTYKGKAPPSQLKLGSGDAATLSDFTFCIYYVYGVTYKRTISLA
jgi:hypothetical protein